jgi:hypothetical protein
MRVLLARLGVLASLMVLGVTAAPPVAMANVPSGNSTQNVYTSARRSQQSWNAGNRTVYVNAILTATLASGQCLDSWFDWTTPEGKNHYDARGARTCVNNQSMYSPVVTEGAAMRGMQKAGGASGPDNATTSSSYVVDAPGHSISITTIRVSMTTQNCSIRYWKRVPGAVETWAGGSPSSPTC